MSQDTIRSGDISGGTPMMGCGHSANATMNDKPVCAICALFSKSGWDVVAAAAPSLEGRTARCSHCGGAHAKSSPELAFFEYRGPGSRSADLTCKCGFWKEAHGASSNRNVCTSFTPKGDDGDFYYCGCRGWD